jgi:hypothetical protein
VYHLERLLRRATRARKVHRQDIIRTTKATIQSYPTQFPRPGRGPRFPRRWLCLARDPPLKVVLVIPMQRKRLVLRRQHPKDLFHLPVLTKRRSQTREQAVWRFTFLSLYIFLYMTWQVAQYERYPMQFSSRLLAITFTWWAHFGRLKINYCE